jgi:hypothetical protein
VEYEEMVSKFESVINHLNGQKKKMMNEKEREREDIN